MEEETHVEEQIEEQPEERSIQEPFPTLPQLFVALGVLLLLFGTSYIPTFNGKSSVEDTPRQNSIVETAVEERQFVNHFENIAIEAEAAYVWDVAKQRALYSKNASAQLPLASLTKLMTALVVYEHRDQSQTTNITLDAIQQEGESGFSAGELWDTESLIDFTLVTSSNDGAFALASAIGSQLQRDEEPAKEAFIRAMNTKAEQLGLSQTYYTNPTGLDETEAQSGSYGSARDMAFLMEYIIEEHPELVKTTTESIVHTTNVEGNLYTASNTNETVSDISGLLGSKTGYTILAGGNLVIAFDAGLNRPIVVSVLGSSLDGRFHDVLTLTQSAIDTLAQ